MRIRITIIAFMIILIDLWGSVNAGGIAEIEVGAGPNFGYLAYGHSICIAGLFRHG